MVKYREFVLILGWFCIGKRGFIMVWEDSLGWILGNDEFEGKGIRWGCCRFGNIAEISISNIQCWIKK